MTESYQEILTIKGKRRAYKKDSIIYSQENNGTPRWYKVKKDTNVPVNLNDTESFMPLLQAFNSSVVSFGQGTYSVTPTNTGRNWHILFSNGFVVQGGDFGSAYTSYTNVTIEFPIPFKDTSYSILSVVGSNSRTSQPSCYNKTNISVTLADTYNGSIGGDPAASWLACGFANSSNVV